MDNFHVGLVKLRESFPGFTTRREALRKTFESEGTCMSAKLLRIHDWAKLAKEAKFKPSIMAALCPISLRQMQRFFEKEFEKTPRQWTRELRCRIALRLIREGWSNKAIAAELHFGNESHFCHEFKRVYGTSPQSYTPVHYPNVRVSSSDKKVAFRQNSEVDGHNGHL